MGSYDLDEALGILGGGGSYAQPTTTTRRASPDLDEALGMLGEPKKSSKPAWDYLDSLSKRIIPPEEELQPSGSDFVDAANKYVGAPLRRGMGIAGNLIGEAVKAAVPDVVEQAPARLALAATGRPDAWTLPDEQVPSLGYMVKNYGLGPTGEGLSESERAAEAYFEPSLTRMGGPVTRELAGQAAEMATPRNVAIMAATGGLGKLAGAGLAEGATANAARLGAAAGGTARGISAGFAAQMLPGAVEKLSQAGTSAYDQGFTPEVAGQFASAVPEAAFAYMAGKHAAAPGELPFQGPKRVAPSMGDELGAVANRTSQGSPLDKEAGIVEQAKQTEVQRQQEVQRQAQVDRIDAVQSLRGEPGVPEATPLDDVGPLGYGRGGVPGGLPVDPEGVVQQEAARARAVSPEPDQASPWASRADPKDAHEAEIVQKKAAKIPDKELQQRARTYKLRGMPEAQAVVEAEMARRAGVEPVQAPEQAVEARPVEPVPAVVEPTPEPVQAARAPLHPDIEVTQSDNRGRPELTLRTPDGKGELIVDLHPEGVHVAVAHVDPKARRQGIGTKLYEALGDEMARRGIPGKFLKDEMIQPEYREAVERMREKALARVPAPELAPERTEPLSDAGLEAEARASVPAAIAALQRKSLERGGINIGRTGEVTRTGNQAHPGKVDFGLTGLPEAPREIAAALKRDKDNPLELRAVAAMADHIDSMQRDQMRGADRRLDERRGPEVPVENERRSDSAEPRRNLEDRRRIAQELTLPEDHPAVERVLSLEAEKVKANEATKAAQRIDPLTGLRSLFAYNEVAKNPDHDVSFIDLQEFKALNDTFGHDAADHVLRRVADILTEEAGPENAYRRSGDEFFATHPKTDLDFGERVMRRLLGETVEVEIDGKRVTVANAIRGHYGRGQDLGKADTAANASRAAKGRGAIDAGTEPGTGGPPPQGGPDRSGGPEGQLASPEEELPFSRRPEPRFSERLNEAAKAVGDRVENFKRWFGESKVVDESGAPLVVYHGTSAKAFHRFNTDSEGAHFGTSEQAESRAGRKAGGGGKTKAIPVFLSIKNPLRLPDIGVWDNFNNLHSHLSVNDHITPKQADLAWDAWQRSDKEGWDTLKAAVEQNGHDGIVYENELEGAGDSYIAFRPEQIKSPKNRGTFDPENPDIRFSRRPPPGQQGLFGPEDDVAPPPGKRVSTKDVDSSPGRFKGETVLRLGGAELTVSPSMVDGAYMSADMNASPSAARGTGAGTVLYLRGLREAQRQGLGWKGDSIQSQETGAMYDRLTAGGVPFKDGRISAEDLARVDLASVERKLGPPQQKTPPKQTGLFGAGALMQGSETKVTEGREAKGDLFTQEQRAAEKADQGRQASLPEPKAAAIPTFEEWQAKRGKREPPSEWSTDRERVAASLKAREAYFADYPAYDRAVEEMSNVPLSQRVKAAEADIVEYVQSNGEMVSDELSPRARALIADDATWAKHDEIMGAENKPDKFKADDIETWPESVRSEDGTREERVQAAAKKGRLTEEWEKLKAQAIEANKAEKQVLSDMQSRAEAVARRITEKADQGKQASLPTATPEPTGDVRIVEGNFPLTRGKVRAEAGGQASNWFATEAEARADLEHLQNARKSVAENKVKEAAAIERAKAGKATDADISLLSSGRQSISRNAAQSLLRDMDVRGKEGEALLRRIPARINSSGTTMMDPAVVIAKGAAHLSDRSKKTEPKFSEREKILREAEDSASDTMDLTGDETIGDYGMDFGARMRADPGREGPKAVLGEERGRRYGDASDRESHLEENAGNLKDLHKSLSKRNTYREWDTAEWEDAGQNALDVSLGERGARLSRVLAEEGIEPARRAATLKEIDFVAEKLREKVARALATTEKERAHLKGIMGGEDAQAERAFKDAEKTYDAVTGKPTAKAERAARDFLDRKGIRQGLTGVKFSEREKTEPKAEPFYSALERAASGAKMGAASGLDWNRYLSDPKRGVKADELKWTGLDDFLRERAGKKVTQAEIKDFLRENAVEVKEVMKGGTKVSDEAREAAGDELDAAMAAYDPDTEAGTERIEAARETLRKIERTDESETKFGQYTLPGGENYRELLLTLPEKVNPKAGADFAALEAAAKAAGEAWRANTGDRALEREMDDAHDRVRQAMADASRDPEAKFRSSHYDEPNILAHVRMNERTDAEGKRTLFVEEIQSDWAQKGRKEGFASKEQAGRTIDTIDADMDALHDMKLSREEFSRRLETLQQERNRAQGMAAGVPSAPFLDSTEKWTGLAAKHVLRYAAENGFDRVAWTRGETQAERYDLSKQIGRMKVTPIIDQHGLKYEVKAYQHDNNRIINQSVTAEELPNVIGKELADKAIRESGGKTPVEYAGLDLKVGGEGMKGYYDQILPNVMGKLGKKWGAKVGETDVQTASKNIELIQAGSGKWRYVDHEANQRQGTYVGPVFETEAEARAWDNPNARATERAHSIDVNEAMKRSVLEEGQPQFASARTPQIPGSKAAGTLSSRTKSAEKNPVRLSEDLSIAHPYESTRGEIEQMAPALRPLARSMDRVLRVMNAKLKTSSEFAGLATDGDYLAVVVGGNKVRVSLPSILDLAREKTLKKYAGATEAVRKAGVIEEAARSAVLNVAHEVAHTRVDQILAKTPELTRRFQAQGWHGKAFHEVYARVLEELGSEVDSMVKRVQSDFHEHAEALADLWSVSNKSWEEAGHGPYRGARGADKGVLLPERGAAGEVRAGPQRVAGGGEVAGVRPGEAVQGSPEGSPGSVPGSSVRGGSPAGLVRKPLKPIPPTAVQKATYEAGKAEGGRTSGKPGETVQNQTTGLEGKESVNLDRASTDEDIRKLVSRVADARQKELGEAKSYRSWDEARDKAVAAGITEADFKRMVKDGAVSDHVIEAGRMLREDAFKKTQDVLRELAAASKEGKDTGDLEAKYESAINKAAGVMWSTTRAGAEAGRALAIHRKMAEGLTDQERLYRKIAKGRPGLSLKFAERFMATDPTDLAGMSALMRAEFKPSKRSMAYEYWINALLSGPPTHAANSIGNTLTQIGRIGEKAFAGGIDAARVKAFGGTRERFVGEAMADIHGLKMGLPKALRVFRSAMTADDMAGFMESGKVEYAPKIPGKIGTVIRTPTRLLSAADAAAKALIEVRESHSLAYRKARIEGKKGDAIGQRMAEILGDLDSHPEIVRGMKKEADYQTFTGQLGKFGTMMMAARDADPTGIARVIVPFYKTPLKIAQYTLERTPLNFIRLADMARRGELKGGKASEEIAKATMGTAVGIGLAMAAQQGFITGGGPSDARENATKRRTGWQPYSLHVGDQYISIQRLEPFSSIAGFAADMVEAKDEKSQGDLADKILGSVAENLTNKTFLQGLENMFLVMSDPKRFASQYFKGLEGSIVPAIAGRAAQAIDPTMRETSALTGSAITARIPGASMLLEPKRTGSGDTTERGGTALERFFSPLPRTTEKGPEADLEREFLDADFTPSRPSKTITVPKTGGKKVTLSDEEYRLFVEADKAATDKLRRVASDPAFKQWDPVRKKSYMRGQYQRAHDSAEARLASLPSYRAKIAEARRRVPATA